MPLNITSASGKGAILGMGEWGDDDLIWDVERPTPSASLVVNDWFWGGGPPDATVIPWTWLQMPLAMRADHPINSAAITRVGQAAALSNATASQTTYGTFAVAGTLDTISPDDAANLAAFLTTYYANPLLRAPLFTMSLVHRTDEERWRILGREIGDRFTLGPGTVQDAVGHTTVLPVPAGLPTANQSLVIEGISHTSSITGRTVEWTTAPLLGISPTQLDTYGRTVAPGGWGTPDRGAWTVDLGTATDFFVTRPFGIMSHSSVGANHSVVADLASPNQIVTTYFRLPVLPTGGGATVIYEQRVRWTDNQNHYAGRIVVDTTGLATFDLRRRSSIFGAAIFGSGPSLTIDPTHIYAVSTYTVGGDIRGKFWDVTVAGPAVPWQVSTNDALVSTGNQMCPLTVTVGITNTLPYEFWFAYAAATTGANPGNVSGPWFRLGSSRLDGNDALPF